MITNLSSDSKYSAIYSTFINYNGKLIQIKSSITNKTSTLEMQKKKKANGDLLQRGHGTVVNPGNW